MTWNPVVAGKELDLYVLYHEVCKQGGVEAVVKSKRWKRVRCSLLRPPVSRTRDGCCHAWPRRGGGALHASGTTLHVPAPCLGNGAPSSRSNAAEPTCCPRSESILLPALVVPSAGDDRSCSLPVQVTVALELPPTCTNAAYTLRKNYYRWLYAFECHDVHNITLSNEEVLPLAFGIMLPGPRMRPIVFCNRSHAAHGLAQNRTVPVRLCLRQPLIPPL